MAALARIPKALRRPTGGENEALQRAAHPGVPAVLVLPEGSASAQLGQQNEALPLPGVEALRCFAAAKNEALQQATRCFAQLSRAKRFGRPSRLPQRGHLYHHRRPGRKRFV